ncbi:MAG: NADH-quinone oxidoreductase subunit L [Planctomycetota bacterium]|jgi:NADH-quinone oxidoreductase subunit L
MSDAWLHVVVSAIIALPVLCCFVLGVPSWFGARISERVVSTAVAWTFSLTTIAAAFALLALCLRGGAPIEVDLGVWFQVDHYEFRWRLLGDWLSLPFACFASLLTGLIAAFSRRYLHRELGFFRFYLLLALFGAGVQVVVLAGGLDLLFFGWELVGLTSALLIAFFHERPKPVEHGLRAFLTYRVCDIGLLAAAVYMHHFTGSAAFVVAAGESAQTFSGLVPPSVLMESLLVGGLLLWASMGKSAQAPLGGWLPRAMEGPTPSSAIFYGAISIHLGPYLLLRAAPILDVAPGVAASVAVVGGLTAVHATFVGRVQTDIKCVLAYASMTQVGLIFLEIGLGLRWLPLLHILGHAAVRSLEILRSPSLLQDYRHLEQAVGRQVVRSPFRFERLFPVALRPWFYRHALERGYFDTLLRDYLVGGFLRACRWLDRCDRWLTSVIVAGDQDQSKSDEVIR